MRVFAYELAAYALAGFLVGAFDSALSTRARPRPPVPHVPRPGGYWN